MKIICLQENLKKILNTTSSIIGKNLTLPVLNNILFDISKGKIKVSSTNLEIGITASVSGKIEEEGKITVPAKILTSFINNLPNKKVEIQTKGKKLKIKSESYQAQINCLSAEEFPIIPKISQKEFQLIGNNVLKEALASVVSVASLSDSRPEITGVLFSGDKSELKLVATDSFRLAERKITKLERAFGSEEKKIVPQRTVQELIKIISENPNGKTKVFFENNQVFFETGDIQVISRLIDGAYPDYDQIIPKETELLLKLEKEEIINSIRLASIFSGKVNEVKLVFDLKKKNLTILSEDPDLGQNRSQIGFEVEKSKLKTVNFEISFNHRYFLDGLNNIFGKKIYLGLVSESSPGILRSVSDSSYLYLLMPIKAGS